MISAQHKTEQYGMHVLLVSLYLLLLLHILDTNSLRSPQVLQIVP